MKWCNAACVGGVSDLTDGHAGKIKRVRFRYAVKSPLCSNGFIDIVISSCESVNETQV